MRAALVTAASVIHIHVCSAGVCIHAESMHWTGVCPLGLVVCDFWHASSLVDGLPLLRSVISGSTHLQQRSREAEVACMRTVAQLQADIQPASTQLSSE